MRLFVGIFPPKSVAKRIWEITGGVPGKREPWEKYHITVSFLGEEDPDYVIERLSFEGLTPFDIRLKGIGAFPNPEKPRVIWVGIEEGGEVLRILHEHVNALLGRPPEERYHPHLTLSRIKWEVEEARTYLREPPFIDISFRVEEIVLVESILRREGSVYRRVHTWRLSS